MIERGQAVGSTMVAPARLTPPRQPAIRASDLVEIGAVRQPQHAVVVAYRPYSPPLSIDAPDGSVLFVPDTQPPPGPVAAPVLQTCPDCGGILEPTDPPWQDPDALHIPTSITGGWQCLLCGYRKP